MPQSFEFGVEVQIDWYEAYADLDGERIEAARVERDYGRFRREQAPRHFFVERLS